MLMSEGGYFSASRLLCGLSKSLTTCSVSNMATLSLVATPKAPEPFMLLMAGVQLITQAGPLHFQDVSSTNLF